MKMKPFASILTSIQGGGGGRPRFAIPSEALVLLTNTACFVDTAQKGQPWCHNHPHHHINRQNAADIVLKQGGIPRLYHDREHPKGDSSEAIPPCSDSPRLPSRNTAGAHPKQDQSPPVTHESIPRLHDQSSQTVRDR